MKKQVVACLFLLFSLVSYSFGDIITKEWANSGSSTYQTANVTGNLTNDIIAEMSRLKGYKDGKITYYIDSDGLNKISEEYSKTKKITRGTEVVNGTTNEADTNMFYRGFLQEGYDTNGIYMGKLNMAQNGESSGYILKSYLAVDKEDKKKTYKVIELIRVNFLDEVANLAYQYYQARHEPPMFMYSPNNFIGEYMNVLGKYETELSTLEGDALATRVYNIFKNSDWYKPGTDYGMRQLFTEQQLLSNGSSPESIQKYIKGRFNIQRGSQTENMFSDGGYTLNYATHLKGYDWHPDTGDIFNTHSSFAATIMAKHNIRTGYFMITGMPGIGVLENYSVRSPFGYYSKFSQWTTGKRWRKKKHFSWDGGYLTEGEQLFTIRSNDLLNYNSADFSNMLGADAIFEQRIIPTILPLPNSISAPTLTPQGHTLTHVISYTGLANNGVAFSNPEFKEMNEFGTIEAGSPTSGFVDGSEVHKSKRAGFGWLGLILIVFAPVIAVIVPFIDIVTIVIIGIILLLLRHKNFDGDVGRATGLNATDATGLDMMVTTKVSGALDGELARYLQYSTVYEDLFLSQGDKEVPVFENLYGATINNNIPAGQDLSNPMYKNAGLNWTTEIHKIWSGEYRKVFSGKDSEALAKFRATYNDNRSYTNIIKAFVEGKK